MNPSYSAIEKCKRQLDEMAATVRELVGIANYINWYTKVILVATFVNFPLDIYHILNDSSLNNCHNMLLEKHTFPVYVLMPVNAYYKIYCSK